MVVEPFDAYDGVSLDINRVDTVAETISTTILWNRYCCALRLCVYNLDSRDLLQERRLGVSCAISDVVPNQDDIFGVDGGVFRDIVLPGRSVGQLRLG